MQDPRTTVEQARASFDRLLQHEKYAALIRDDAHLELLLAMANVKENEAVLDLGTGAGYLAFALAKAQPSAQILGLDIAEGVIRLNGEKAAQQGLHNLRFASFDGLRYPFPPERFDLIVTRHALHHFPQIEQTAQAMAALLKPGGRLLIADPLRHSEDVHGLIDRFMAVKADGHMRFYDPDELARLFAPLTLESSVITQMRFPFPPKPEYNALLAQATETEKAWYALGEKNGTVHVGSIRVGNLLFRKTV